MDFIKSLEEVVLQVLDREGMSLYDIEFNDRQRKLVVTINKDGGVSVDDCAVVSKGLNLLLDVENIIPGKESYYLEVSSPGLERALRKVEHYKTAVGQRAQVSLKKGYEKPDWGQVRLFKAVIEEVGETSVKFNDVENSKVKSFEIPIEAIHKAHLIFDFGQIKKH